MNILVLLVDPKENSPSPGAVDFAFVIEMKNSSIANFTPIYPTGPGEEHPTAPPNMVTTNLQIKLLYLHNSLYDVPLKEGTKQAQEIVEYKQGIKTDVVVIVNPEAVDAILAAIGGVEVNGSIVTNNSVDFLREEQSSNNISRPDIVENVGYAVRNASRDKSKRIPIIQAMTIQYTQGNIVVVPDDVFFKLIKAEGVKSIFG